MRKRSIAAGLMPLLLAGNVMASGYRIPEQSVDATAKAGANIAGADGADAAYYNPANMSWLDNTGWLFEGDVSGIYLSSIDYNDNRSSLYDCQSEDEGYVLPTFFLVSPEYAGLHFGLSLTAPYGLSKRWKDGLGAAYAQEFSLKVFELNPTLSYKVNDWLSLALGGRVLYSDARVKSNGLVADPYSAGRDISGDSLDYGWNAAVSVRPTEKSNISLTYRSLVDLDIDGDGTLWTDYPSSAMNVTSDANVTVPAPAVMALAGSYDFGKLKVEIAVDRTFWSAWEDLDLDYSVSLSNPVLFNAFDKPATRNWKDANAYRFSSEYEMRPGLTLMGGFAYDKTPVPDATADFSLPDSDAYLFSLGARVALSERLQVAGAFLYDYKEARQVHHGSINGNFDGASALLFTLGFSYLF